MPVEIRELVIRAVTTLETQDARGQAQDRATPADQEALIQECVRQVLRILEKKKER